MKYLYTGPLSGVTLQDKSGKAVEIMLLPNREVELPDTHDYTKTLVALGHLQELATPSAPAGAPSKGPGRSAGQSEDSKQGA